MYKAWEYPQIARRITRADYRWLHIWEAASHAKTNNVAMAESLLNKAFAKSPTKDVEQTIRHWRIFDPVKGSTNINWPSQSETDAQPEN